MQQYNMRVGANAVIVRDGAVLLVEFDDDTGRHFNLPGGGIEADESIQDGLRREVMEETCAEIDPGSLLFAVEYFPPRHEHRYGSTRKLGLIFRGYLRPGSEPRLPEQPDANQVGVRWVPTAELPDAPLLPRIGERLTELLLSPGTAPGDPFCGEI